jgi:hypothetical protein
MSSPIDIGGGGGDGGEDSTPICIHGENFSVSVTTNSSEIITDVTLTLGSLSNTWPTASGAIGTLYAYIRIGGYPDDAYTEYGPKGRYINTSIWTEASTTINAGTNNSITLTWGGLTASQPTDSWASTMTNVILSNQQQTNSSGNMNGEELGFIEIGKGWSDAKYSAGTTTLNSTSPNVVFYSFPNRGDYGYGDYNFGSVERTYDTYSSTQDDYSYNKTNMGINCLLKGTRVLSSKGYIYVHFLQKGDYVYNKLKEKKKIKRILKQTVSVDKSDENRDLFKDIYKLKNGILKVSGGHMVQYHDGSYILPIYSDKFDNIQKDKSVNQFYHIELEDYDFFLAEGVYVESLCTDENLQQKIDYYKERGLEYQDLISSNK